MLLNTKYNFNFYEHNFIGFCMKLSPRYMKEGIQMEKLFKPGKYYSRVKTVFVAFLIFFPGSLTVVHRGCR